MDVMKKNDIFVSINDKKKCPMIWVRKCKQKFLNRFMIVAEFYCENQLKLKKA